ncbi:MAG: DUF456 domain-containing protein [Chloroflexota bacterium]
MLEVYGNYIIPAFTLVVMLIGLFGLLMPIFPGGLVIWLASLIYGVLHPEHFGETGGVIFVIITILAILSALADNLLMGAKAKESGASWRGILLALAAGLIFSILFTPIIGLIMTPLTLYLSEYQRLQKLDKSVEAAREEAKIITKGLMIGCGWAFVVRFGLGAAKIALWARWAWVNGI